MTGARALFALLALGLAAQAAHASLRLCNRTSYVLYAAAVSGGESKFTVQGWTRIVPGTCTVALLGDLTAPSYYLYAHSSRAHAGPPRAWGGNTAFCTKNDDFKLQLAYPSQNCAAPDMTALPFSLLDTHHMRSWTVTFREEPDFPSMQAAEQAGLKRLLADNGMRKLDGDKAYSAALAGFEKRLHLSDKAGSAGLFDALETEALRSAAPLGYTVCNDTVKPVFAALGEQDGKVFVSRGWWMVAPASCARTLAQSVAGKKIWLRVERGKSKALVEGPQDFCVTNIEFEIQGRERCKERGLRQAGFLETNSAGAPGYEAHISDDGMVLATGKPK